MRNDRGIIVAMTEDGVIGLNGAVPWHYPADLRRFKRTTLDSTVIMGRVTWESLPFKPLPGRRNIVVTRDAGLDVENYPSVAEAVRSAGDDRIWFIGGAGVYREAAEHSDLIDVTHVPDRILDANALKFPDIDWSRWQAGERIRFKDDARLCHQRFTRGDSARGNRP